MKESVVMFTDIKDFTLKTSLLTEKQLTKLLEDHDKIVRPSVKDNNGAIIKTIGDAFMIVFDTVDEAIKAGIEIQNKAHKYNINKKIGLFSIDFRIAIDKGNLVKKTNISGEDYFGEGVNLASRLEDVTPGNRIIITDNVYKDISQTNNITARHLGKTNFKGILRGVDVYEIIHNELSELKEEEKQLILEDTIAQKKVKSINQLSLNAAFMSAILGLQQIPILDTYYFIPIHLFLLIKIAHIYEERLTKERSYFMSLIIISLGLLSATIPWSINRAELYFPDIKMYCISLLSFCITYITGILFGKYCYYKNFGIALSGSDISNLFHDTKIHKNTKN